MPGKSAIEWTDATWNPVTGCSKVSPGCEHCYAEAIALRFGRSKLPWTKPNASENVQLHPERLNIPLTWKRPRKIFVNSVSDLFHELVPDEFIDQVFAVMALTPWHTFQVLTKRPERMFEYLGGWMPYPYERRGFVLQEAVELAPLDRRFFTAAGDTIAAALPWPLPNVWLGTSVEDQRRADERIPHLVKTPAAVRFLSCEPLLGPLNLEQWLWHKTFLADGPRGVTTGDLDWIITGGESGHGHRPIEVDWVRSIRDQCQDAGVVFFHKQWGGITPKAGGRDLDGRTWDDFPAVAL